MVETRNSKRKVEDKQGGDKLEESSEQTNKEIKKEPKSPDTTDLSDQFKRRPPTTPKKSTSTSSSRRKSKLTKSASPSSRVPTSSSQSIFSARSTPRTLPHVDFSETKPRKKKQIKTPQSGNPEVEIDIPEGDNPEIYTDDHKKLLGDSVADWTLFVDGFDEDGQLIYDPNFGTSCHQCGHKTIGVHTDCSKCKTGTGQLCGDCLYIRYGENATEANLNKDWICPVCRGICNCDHCRIDKGWSPTGAIYKKVAKLGFKSVAHYLILHKAEAAQGSVAGKEGSSGARTKSGAKEEVEAGDSASSSDKN